MATINLSDSNLYDLLQDKIPESVKKLVEPEPAPASASAPVSAPAPAPAPVNNSTLPPVNNKPPVELTEVTMTNRFSNFMTKKSFTGFLLFAAIIIVLALCIYFTLYRLGWGVSSCINKNYHDCGVLLTPELAPVALTGLVSLI